MILRDRAHMREIDHPNTVVDTDPIDTQRKATMNTDIEGSWKDKKRMVKTECSR